MADRRTFLRGLAALAAVAVPAGVAEALAAEMPPTGLPLAVPAVFDPAVFC